MNDPHHTPLGPEGRIRRDVMLGELLHEVDRVRRMRRVKRRTTVALSVVAIAVLTVRFVEFPSSQNAVTERVIVDASPDGQTQPASIPAHENDNQRAHRVVRIVSADHSVNVVRVKSDSMILDRYAADLPTGLVRWLDDRELLETLTSIDRPAGLIRMGRTVRLSRPVSDAELALLPATPADHYR